MRVAKRNPKQNVTSTAYAPDHHVASDEALVDLETGHDLDAHECDKIRACECLSLNDKKMSFSGKQVAHREC